MKKAVLKLDLHDDKAKQKALKTVTTLSGIDAISMNMKEKKLTVIGRVDPVNVVSKLRKYWQTDIISVGPDQPEKKLEEPEKEEEKKAEEPKKEEPQRAEEPKKEEEAKKGEEKIEENKNKKKKKKKKELVDPVIDMVRAYRAYNPHMTKYYYVQSMEEDPNSCVIS